jgi:N-acetyl-gamma-glutamyl-phosphate reductase
VTGAPVCVTSAPARAWPASPPDVDGIRAGIVGHTGYAGEELVACLRRHDLADVVLLDATSPREVRRARPPREAAPKALQQARRALASPSPAVGLPRRPLDEALLDDPLDVVLLATPAPVSLELVPRLLAAGTRVVDLSGAFRLPEPEAFEAWYGIRHYCPELLAEAVYGLPEFNRAEIVDARLVANPGCLATAAAIAIRPLQRAGLVDAGSLVVCDAKSGVSGAGKESRSVTSFCTIADNFLLYGTMTHRHVPEILGVCGLEEERFLFSSQLLPVRRGVLATVYFQLAAGKGSDDVGKAFAEAYGDEVFVEVYEEGAFPNLASVVHTNCCRLGYAVSDPGGRVLVVSALDNLCKGGAGQAVQNLDVMFGFPETEGLPQP